MESNQLPPNKFGNQTGTLDPSSTGFDRERGNNTYRGNAMSEMGGTNPQFVQRYAPTSSTRWPTHSPPPSGPNKK